MRNTRVAMLLHPTRMKIVQTLTGQRRLTVQQMIERLPSIPQATLYRHLNKLVEAGLVEAVEENPVRGTVEKVYALSRPDPIDRDELRDVTRDEHLQYFLAFTANLATAFDHYMHNEPLNPIDDGWMSYRQADLQFTEREYRDFIAAFHALVESAVTNEPGPDRRAVTFASIVIPEPSSRGTGKAKEETEKP